LITISRSIIRQIRTVLKRAGIYKTRLALSSPLFLIGSREGLKLRAQSHEVAICYDLPGDFAAEQMILPQQFLDDCEGRKDEPVTLEAQPDGRSTAQWREAGIPQLVQYDAWKKPISDWPAMPETLAANEPGLLEALAMASETTDSASSRFALGCIQFQGDNGSLAATDGRQLLVQRGYKFPWEVDLLAAGVRMFSGPDLPHDESVGIGRTDQHVVLTVGRWTIWLAIEAEARFPKTDDLVRAPETATNRCRFSPGDAKFLARSLGHLPSEDEIHYPVTVDLNGHVAVRGKSREQDHPTEIVLSASTQEGEPRHFNMNREYLARALRLGLHELCFFGADQVIQAHDERRSYLWMPLRAEGAIPPSPDAIRIESQSADAAAAITPPKKTRKPTVNSNPSPTAVESTSKPRLKKHTEPDREIDKGGNGSPIEQAKRLRASLRETLAETNRLIVSLRRHQKQSKVVASTLASLKQLQAISA
jgi:hypothetical protein